MLTAPRNLSRPPRKTCSPARAKNHSGMSGRFRSISPTPCRSKRTCTYDSQTRLESCSRDPIGYDGSPWNLYEYVNGNPINLLDPFGLETEGAGDGAYEFFAELLPCGSISFSYAFSVAGAGGIALPQFVVNTILGFAGLPALPAPGTIGGGTTPCLPCTRCCITSKTTTNSTISFTGVYTTAWPLPNIPFTASLSTTTVVSTGSCVDVKEPCPPVVNNPPINLPPVVINIGSVN